MERFYDPPVERLAFMERFYDPPVERLVYMERLREPPLEREDIAYLPDRLVHVVVDHLISVLVCQGHLISGLLESLLDGFLGFGAPPAKPLLQFRQRARPKKNRDGLGISLDDG